MSINSVNGTSKPGVTLGTSATMQNFMGLGSIPPAGTLNNTLAPKQVMGLVPVYACCESSTQGGSSGCSSFTITMGGDCTNAVLQLNFVLPGGMSYLQQITAYGSSCSALTAKLVEQINSSTPFIASIVSGCEVSICTPNIASYFGTRLTLNIFQSTTGVTQASSQDFITPYAFGSSQSWWNSVTLINVNYVKIACGTNTYTVPLFSVPITGSAADMTVILNTLNSYFTNNSLPFTAIADPSNPTTQFKIQGTGYTNQNGCEVTVWYQFYGATKNSLGILGQGPSVMKGGAETNTTLGLVGGYPQTLTLGTLPTVTYDVLGCGDCRQGKYTPDIVPDDRAYQLPVFANPSDTTFETNDYNLFMLQYPVGYNAIGSGDFTLLKLVGGIWVTKATLQDNTYGYAFDNSSDYPFYTNSLPPLGSATSIGGCPTIGQGVVNYNGYWINWLKVYSAFGAGVYKFQVKGNAYGQSGQGQDYCLQSQQFCLSLFNCENADHTVKFEAWIQGGNRGDTNIQGNFWNFDCPGSIFLPDSIRFYGFFGNQGKDGDEIQRDQIKYQTGIINKVRDELIKKYELWISPMPDWFHQRFEAYALMADWLYVTDDNYNNANYNFKHFYVVADTGYTRDHKFESRYQRVSGTVKFKDGQQFVFADRC